MCVFSNKAIENENDNDDDDKVNSTIKYCLFGYTAFFLVRIFLIIFFFSIKLCLHLIEAHSYKMIQIIA